MEHLDFPDQQKWEERYEWFNNLLEEKQGYQMKSIALPALAIVKF